MYTSSSPGLTLLDEGRSSIHKKIEHSTAAEGGLFGRRHKQFQKATPWRHAHFHDITLWGGGWVMHYGIEETGKLETSITCRVMYDEHKQEQWDKKL